MLQALNHKQAEGYLQRAFGDKLQVCTILLASCIADLPRCRTAGRSLASWHGADAALLVKLILELCLQCLLWFRCQGAMPVTSSLPCIFALH